MFERLSQRGSFTEEEARNIVKQVGQGLKHMHDNHIIHRDLKVSFLFFLSSFSIDRLVTISLSFSPFLLPHLAWEYTLYRSQWFRDNKNLWFWYGQNCWTESCSHSMWNRYPCHFLNKFSFFFFSFCKSKQSLTFCYWIMWRQRSSILRLELKTQDMEKKWIYGPWGSFYIYCIPFIFTITSGQ